MIAATAQDAFEAEPARRTGLVPLIGYSFGQIAGQVFRDLPSLLLLFYMTSVLGIAPAVAGAAIFVPKLVWGVGSDLLVGILSDRWKRRFPRRNWLLIGALGAPAAMLLLFHVPHGSDSLRIGYVAIVFSLYMLVFASFSVPYLALAGELTSSPRQRNVLMAWRLAFTAVGVMVSGGIAPALVQRAGGGEHGFQTMAITLAVICPIALLIAWFGTRAANRRDTEVASHAPRVRMTAGEAARALLAPKFFIMLCANLLQLVGQGMSYAAMLYFLSYNMGRPDALTLIGGLVIAACAGILVAQPLWVGLAARFGKRNCYIAGATIHGLFYFIWGFGASWGASAAIALAFLAAIGNSGWAMLGFSMVADVAAEDERRAGLYSAAWISTDKIAFALGGTLLTGLIFSAFGFDSARAVAGLPQSDSALIGVMVVFGVVPGVLNFVGALLMCFAPKR
ncbi:MFS transporter [Sphingomonas populi]|uniref:MFS transporter n=1 Tax=Sphingomonas populi TaxID=2484750 RepID=A0A4Q6XZP3_9SPHN|nr:MFS transporter [Sphingomonas populi]RZF66010.1 MFS transporter [Sphingomonas populi]